MGIIENIDIESFPKQSAYVGEGVKVWFRLKADEFMYGTIVRDDLEEPHLTIIKLEDDRYVLSTECQYTMWVGYDKQF